MAKQLLLTCGLVVCSVTLNAQYHLKENYNWSLGLKSRLNFNTNPPDFDSSGIYYRYAGFFGGFDAGTVANASVSDTAGTYLFCTNGDQVWNANHNAMPNSSNLTGLTGYNAIAGYVTAVTETRQGALITPVLHDTAAGKQYYVFSLTSNLMGGPSEGATQISGPNAMAGRLYYSVVDMNLDGGLGDVVNTQKGILLDSVLVPSGIVGIAACGKYWIIAHDRNANAFKSYAITKNGISNAVISNAGANINGYGYLNIAVSSDGSRLAVASRRFSNAGIGSQTGSYLELYDFDNETGIISNAVTIDDTSTFTAVCFSPDNSKLYVLGYINAVGGIYQYDLNAGTTATAISGSKVLVSPAANSMNWYGNDIKLAPDKKVYFWAPSEAPNYLYSINYPDSSGVSCGYEDSVLAFRGDPVSQGMFSNDFVKPLSLVVATITDTACRYTISEEILTESGIYTRILQNRAGCDSASITLHLTVPELNPVITVDDQFTLSTIGEYYAYQWMLNGNIISGETNRNLTLTQNGDYQVIVTNDLGCVDTSDIYVVNNVSVPDIYNDYSFVVFPNPAHDEVIIQTDVSFKNTNVSVYNVIGKKVMAEIKLINNQTNLNISKLCFGIYWLKITDEKGTLLKVEKIVKQ